MIKIPITCEEWFVSSYMKDKSKLSGNSSVNSEIIHKPILHFDIPNNLKSNNYNKNSPHLYDFWNHPAVQQLHFIIVGESNINETLGPACAIVMREGSHF
jgi:hypothetical protein